jgi:hypothetical protein
MTGGAKAAWKEMRLNAPLLTLVSLEVLGPFADDNIGRDRAFESEDSLLNLVGAYFVIKWAGVLVPDPSRLCGLTESRDIRAGVQYCPTHLLEIVYSFA